MSESIFESVAAAQKIEKEQIKQAKEAAKEAKKTADAQTAKADFLAYLKDNDFRMQSNEDEWFDNYKITKDEENFTLKILVDFSVWKIICTTVNLSDRTKENRVVEYDISGYKNSLEDLKTQLEAIFVDVSNDNSFDVLAAE